MSADSNSRIQRGHTSRLVRCALFLSFISSLVRSFIPHYRPMTSLVPWQSSNLDRVDSSGGQNWLDEPYMAEPDLLACEVFDSEKAMYAPISEHYASRDGADSYDPFPSAAVPFDGYAHQQHPSLAVDVFRHPFDVSTPCFAGSPYSHLSKGPSSTRSNSSTETEYSNEDDQQGHICQECNKVFRNFQELDQHTKRVPHKAWRCAEPFCGRTYARRDTFLRHRATHGDKSHACAICSHHNKQKVFKRKDHLKEHIRNCHLPKGTEATCVDGVRSVELTRETISTN